LNFARLEWLVAIRRRRAFVLNIIVPFALVAALAAGNAPTVHTAVVCAVLFAFFGTFGSAIPLVRDAETGRLTALLQAGANPSSLLVQRVLVGAGIDVLHLLPAVAILAFAYRGTAAPLLICLPAALIAANTLGTWVAAITRSIGESALVSSVAALTLLHVGGVFRTPVPNTWSAAIEPFSPFKYLHESLVTAVGSSATATATATATGVFVALASVGTVAIGAPRIARSLRVGRR